MTLGGRAPSVASLFTYMFSFEYMVRNASSMVSMYLSLSSCDAAAAFAGGLRTEFLFSLLLALSLRRKLPKALGPPWP